MTPSLAMDLTPHETALVATLNALAAGIVRHRRALTIALNDKHVARERKAREQLRVVVRGYNEALAAADTDVRCAHRRDMLARELARQVD